MIRKQMFLLAHRATRGMLALMMLAFSVPALAQSDNSQISGFVRDQAGAVVAGAKVTVRSETKVTERTAVTNADGYFIVANLPPDVYSVTVEQTGFRQFKETGRKLDPNIPASLDVALQTGEISETVSVVASASAVQSESSTVGRLIEGKQIEALQLNGRNPLFLALLKPGVSGGALGGFSFGLSSGGFNINGSRSQDNLITFDGAVGIRTRSNGTSIGVADLDSTQEIQVLTANYNAEYGRSSGGQIRIVTRSGGQQFHGTFYEYLRNSALNANSWGRNAATPANQPCTDARFKAANHCRPEPFRYNQFGYNLSGPVIIPGTNFNKDRNKLFWLFGQEWVKFRREQTTIIRVPTQRMRQGDFSELFPGGPNYLAQLQVPMFMRDPLKTGACSASDQSACFNDGGVVNKIPTNRLSRNGLALMRALPEPIQIGRAHV